MQRVLIIQDSFRALSTVSVRHVLHRLSLKRGDKVKFLGIIQPFTQSNRSACGSFLQHKKNPHSSEAIEEETQKTLDRYSSCAECKEILKIAETLQVEFEIAVEAGSLKEVSVEYAKSYQATHVILHRQLKKELRYFAQNLSCGVSRMKSDDSLQTIRPPQTDESIISALLEDVTPTLNMETTFVGADDCSSIAFDSSSCSLCMNRRPAGCGVKKKFTYAELQLATNAFSQQNLMSDHGKKIYLGLLNDQRKTLIRENSSVTIKEGDFRGEVKMLEGIRHKNVALLVGSCSEGPHRFLVYEYVCNGSLNKHLSNKSKELTWERRINILFGAAKGLEYLHTESIYGGVRPSNILITHDYEPLLSYYGLTVYQYEALGQSSETKALRTFEHLAPEYEETGVDLSKADVYSFGVVLVELISGRKTIQETDGLSFLSWARPLLRQKKYMKLVDPLVQDSVNLYQLYWLVRLAEKCLNWDPRRRYSMKKVVKVLSDIISRTGVEDFSPTESEL